MKFTQKKMEEIVSQYNRGVLEIQCPESKSENGEISKCKEGRIRFGENIDGMIIHQLEPTIFPNVWMLKFYCDKCGRSGEHPC